MNNSLPPSLASFHLQQHSTDHTQQSNISEADFLARVSAFERNEEAEKRRAREAMRRMVAEQTTSTRHDRGGSGGPRRRDRSPPNGSSSVGIFREFPYHFQGPVPTSQPPPQPPVAGFNIYGHPLNSKAPASVYPFFEILTGGPPPLQDAYHDALVLVSAPYHLTAAAPFTSHPTRPSDPAPFPGRDVPPLRIMPSYYPHPHDLTRDTHDDDDDDRRRERRGLPSYSPGRNQQETQDPARGNTAVWPYSSPVNPHGCAPPAPPPRISTHLAPPTSPASLGFHHHHHHHHHHRSQPSSKNTSTMEPTTTTEFKKRQTSFRVDYDLRTHPATLRVSPSSSSILSKPACTPNEQDQVNIRLTAAAAPRVAASRA